MSIGDRIFAVKRSAEEEFLRRPGVHGVGVGLRYVNGEATGELAIQVFVREKRPLASLPPEERIPGEIDGIKTDVIEMQPFTLAVEDPGQYRPVRGGTQIASFPETKPDGSIAHYAGTLGCIATTTGSSPQVVALTNHHVLFHGTNKIGSDVGQPDVYGCGECCSNVIGKILDSKFDPLIDAAIVALSPGIQWLAEIAEIGTVKGTHHVSLDDLKNSVSGYPVKKRGRSTGLTTGRVVSIDFKDQQHTNQLGIMPGDGVSKFCDDGDSGSVVVNSGDEVVGLLWGKDAGSGGAAATPIEVIESQLKITICTATQKGVIQTVPGAAAHKNMSLSGGRSVHSVKQLEPLHNVDALGGWVPLARIHALSQQGLDVARLLRHAEEVRRLIFTNRKVAVAWQRGRGTEMLRFLASERTIPLAEREPILWTLTLGPFVALLDRYGSAALRADLVSVLRDFALIERQAEEAKER